MQSSSNHPHSHRRQRRENGVIGRRRKGAGAGSAGKEAQAHTIWPLTKRRPSDAAGQRMSFAAISGLGQVKDLGTASEGVLAMRAMSREVRSW